MAEHILLITDPGKDLDDEQCLILAAGLHRRHLAELSGVVANLDPPKRRAALAKGTLITLGLPMVPVGIGQNCFLGGKNMKHECDAPYVYDGDDLPDGQEVLCARLADLPSKSATLVLNSGLTDAAMLFMNHRELFLDTVKNVCIMGGVVSDGNNYPKLVPYPDGNSYMIPDDSANNSFDWAAGLYLYAALQEAQVPMTMLMRWCAYGAQFPFSLYDRFKETGNPIGANLHERQKPSICQLWAEANDPPGGEIRGKLPVSRTREWFVQVFCNKKDPGDISTAADSVEIWDHLAEYNQYDPLNYLAAIPELRDKYFDPIEVTVKGTTHRIIGLEEGKPCVKDKDGLLAFMTEVEIEALRGGETE